MRKIFLTIAVLSATGCASITEGTSQTVTVNSAKPCSVARGGLRFETTPEKPAFALKKSNEPIRLDCGGKVTTVQAEASPAAITGALFLDFGIVDMITGAFWKYPDSVTIESEAL